MSKKFKIVFLRSNKPFSFASSYFNAMKRLDVDVVDVPFDPHVPEYDMPLPEGDFLLMVDCGKPVDFHGLKDYRGPTGYVSIDSCHKFAMHKAYCEKYEFDHIWVAQKHMVSEFRGAVWLPLAADELVHAYRPEMLKSQSVLWRLLRRKHYDIGMCCAPYKHRRRFEKVLRKAGLTTNFHFRKKFGVDATVETALCTIGFNVGAGFTGERGMDINMRVFETMANGKAMLLTNTYENLGFEDLFDEGRHYIGYRTEEEAVDKALYYARHVDEAAQIALAGQAHILAGHTYLHRCRKILEKVGKG